MDKEAILEKFKQIKVWRRNSERAPHKCLLVVYAMGKLLREGIRLIPYSEIDDNLGQLLQQFGPGQLRQGTQYPFWRLQSDGVWEVPEAERIGQTTSGDALKKDLLDYDASGGFLSDIAREFQKDSKLSFQIIQHQLDTHFPPSRHADILQAVGLEFPLQISTRRGRNPKFRRNILKAYEYRCAICGFDVKLEHSPIGLEAVHIQWYSHGGPDVIVNGLALCSLHHVLFDGGAFTLSERLEVLVSDDAHGSAGFQEWLMRFHGREINFPQRQSYYPDGSHIGWHVKEVFKGGYREL